MTWIWKQKLGELLHDDSHIAWGYAGGNCGQSPEGKNNPDMQNVPKVGPLPQGLYKFGTPVLQSHLGPFAIPLVPDPGNQMFGRSDFFVHGDTISNPGCASEGCIILPRAIRNMLAASPDNDLQVVSGE
jgi:hypothetical protein